MEPKDWIRLTADNPALFPQMMALVGRWPDGFRPRSSATEHVDIDPLAARDEIISAIIKASGTAAEVFWTVTRARRTDVWINSSHNIVFVKFMLGGVDLDVVSDDDNAEETVDQLLSALKPFKAENKEEAGVWADFSYMGNDGLNQVNQFIRCPEWTEIAGNYPGMVGQTIGKSMDLADPWRHGRLLIWHGEPGTGKTYAIRALLMAWRKRFDFLVVTDPEHFAAQPSYYFEVASQQSDQPVRCYVERRAESRARIEVDAEEADGTKRVLFILEDCADLILQANRATHGDKIGKLLNMTDGLFGQGREDIFLLTFNEEVDRIDPAFLRPGRLIESVEFGKFDMAEAVGWLRRHGRDLVPAKRAMTLAELYAQLMGGPVGSAGLDEKGSRGFAPLNRKAT